MTLPDPSHRCFGAMEVLIPERVLSKEVPQHWLAAGAGRMRGCGTASQQSASFVTPSGLLPQSHLSPG